MAIRRIDEIVRVGEHPLEKHFDIESGSTEIVTTKRSTELIEHETYDEKDKEIEDEYQQIADRALDLVDKINEHIEGGAEAKFLARLVEVAGQQLNIALSAAEKRAKLKAFKDNIDMKKKAPGKVTNNTTIVMSQTELLRQLRENQSQVIDAEVISKE